MLRPSPNHGKLRMPSDDDDDDDDAELVTRKSWIDLNSSSLKWCSLINCN